MCIYIYTCRVTVWDLIGLHRILYTYSYRYKQIHIHTFHILHIPTSTRRYAYRLYAYTCTWTCACTYMCRYLEYSYSHPHKYMPGLGWLQAGWRRGRGASQSSLDNSMIERIIRIPSWFCSPVSQDMLATLGVATAWQDQGQGNVEQTAHERRRELRTAGR